MNGLILIPRFSKRVRGFLFNSYIPVMTWNDDVTMKKVDVRLPVYFYLLFIYEEGTGK